MLENDVSNDQWRVYRVLIVAKIRYLSAVGVLYTTVDLKHAVTVVDGLGVQVKLNDLFLFRNVLIQAIYFFTFKLILEKAAPHSEVMLLLIF